MENGTLHSQAALARQHELVVQELPDEVMVYDLKRHKAHCLNKTAALVWNHCDGQTSVAALTELLRQEAGSAVDEDVVWYALEKLSKAELLEGKLNLPVKDGLSRRRMIRRLGTMIVIPAVISLVAPTALAQASVVTLGKKIPCGQCNQQGNPAACTNDTCCTGSCGGPQRTCIQTGGPGTQPGTVVSSCAGPFCVAASNAAPCT